MIRTSKRFAWVLGCVLAIGGVIGFSNSASAAAFVRFDGVTGDCKDKDHKNWIDVLSFRQDITTSGPSTGRRNSSNAVKPIILTAGMDSASPRLAEAAITGKNFKNVTINLTASYSNAGRKTYYSYELSNVRIISYKLSGSGQSEDVPVAEFAIVFDAMTVTFTKMDPRGGKQTKISYTWRK